MRQGGGFMIQEIRRQEPTAYTKQQKIVLSPAQTGIRCLSSFGFASCNKAPVPLLSHVHKEKLECMLVISGIQSYIVNDVRYTLYEKEAFFIRPNEPHSFVENTREDIVLLWFQIDLSLEDGFFNLPKPSAHFLLERLSHMKGRKFLLADTLKEQFAEAFFLLANESGEKKLKGQSLFLYCLLSLLEQDPVLELLSEDVDYAKQYILEHIKDSIDIDELLVNSSLNAVKFKQKFEQQIGMKPKEFINVSKIDHLKARVAETKDSLTDIAFEYHFSSVKYFKMIFKRYMGYSPAKYRRIIRKEVQKEKE